MTISRITTWVDGQILTAAALNNEFDNIISNATALISPLTTSLNFNGNQAVGLVLENRVATPSPNATGQIYLYTPEELVVFKGGTHTDILIGPSEGVSRVQGLSGSMISNIGSFQAQSYQMVRNANSQRLAIAITATSSYSINTQTAGPIANGRDQAAAFGSTDVHFYAMATGPFSTAPQGVCSSNPPSVGPTAVGTYLYWAYLGSAKYNTATSVVLADSIQHGSRVRLKTAQNLMTVVGSTTVSVTSAATQPSGVIPHNAVHQLIRPRAIAGAYSALGAVDIEVNFYPTSTVGPSEYYRMIAQGPASAGQSQTLTQTAFLLPVVGSTPELYYDVAVNTGLSASLGVDAVGYIVANGDN